MSDLIEYIESRFDQLVGLNNFVEATDLEEFGFVREIAAELAAEIFDCPVGMSTWDIVCRHIKTSLNLHDAEVPPVWSNNQV